MNVLGIGQKRYQGIFNFTIYMKSKIIKSALLALLFLFFVSWFYKIAILMLFAYLWRKEIKSVKPWGYRVVMGTLLIIMFCVLPRYRYNTSDRVQLIYQNEKGKPEYPPLTHYLVNVFLPEEELCNWGIWSMRLIPKVVPLYNWIVEEFTYDIEKGNIANFYHPYEKLNRGGLFMMSGTTSQVFNMMGLGNTQSVYLIKPKKFDKKKKYPVVFFMHGFLGNWKLYNGLLEGLDDCFVLSVGTKTWSGIYTKNDVNALFTRQILFLENLGYKVDKDSLHIVGLSNGGSAANVAYCHFPKRFKTISFVSTGIHQTYPISSRVLFIGGGKDHSSGSLPKAWHILKRNGADTDLFWKDDETHFIFVNRTDEIVNFLNRNIR